MFEQMILEAIRKIVREELLALGETENERYIKSLESRVVCLEETASSPQQVELQEQLDYDKVKALVADQLDALLQDNYELNDLIDRRVDYKLEDLDITGHVESALDGMTVTLST